MWRHFASNLLTIMIVLLVVVVGLIGWGQQQYVAEGPLAEPICLQVPRGSSMASVADRLVEQGAISNATVYRLGAQYSGRSPALKAGSFLIEEGTSMAEIVAEITGDGLSTCGTEVIYLIAVNSQRVRVRELNAATQEFEVTAEFDPKEEAERPETYVEALEDVATRFRVVVVEGVKPNGVVVVWVEFRLSTSTCPLQQTQTVVLQRSLVVFPPPLLRKKTSRAPAVFASGWPVASVVR